MRIVVLALVSFGLCFGSACAVHAAVSPGSGPDTVLYNGKVISVNDEFDIHQAIAIRGDSILAVGSDDEMLQLANASTRVVDLAQHAVIPGLIDNHVHLINNAVAFHQGVGVALVDSIEEMVARIGDKVKATPPGEIVFTSSGWLPSQLKEQRVPTRFDLDPVSPNHPVVVLGGHSLYLNSYALEKAGITRDTPSPPGGTIVKDPDTGEPTGMLVENASSLAARIVSSSNTETWKIFGAGAASAQEKLDALRAAQRKLNAAGITSIREPGLSPDDMRVYQKLRDDGELSLRVSMSLSLSPYESQEVLIGQLRTWGVSTGFGDEFLRLDGVGEFGIDGGFEGGLMSEPYENSPGNEEAGDYYGLQRIPTEKYQGVMQAMSELGWRSTSHIVGDRGLDIALDAYEAADRVASITSRRWVIEHGHYTRPDQFERIRELGLVISTQFHPYMAAQNMVHYWGESRANQAMRLRDWLDAGIVVGGGSDWTLLPANPFWMLYFWVTRESRLGGVTGYDQRITREEALQVMTRNNAYITFEEDIKGSLEPGKLADLVVLSDDYLTVPEADIREITPLLVLLDGNIVFDAGVPSVDGARRAMQP
ncbi:amidohydrolase [Elongatibacter sediminis]|uniref:Amidohydrolase n=1 Tax=Elongatibacter sediminis TaxID=3119006 RepID=A0AAW9RAP1_9GAMM